MDKHADCNIKKAFTIIELIIIVGIISIIGGFTIASFNSYGDTQTLKAEASKFTDVFNITRKRAVSSERPENCTLNNYSITFPDVNSYRVTQDLDGDGCNDTTQTYSLNSKLAFTARPNDFTISPLTGSLSAEFASTIKLTTNKCYNINISILGIPSISENTSCP